jgi:hypothetical protein
MMKYPILLLLLLLSTFSYAKSAKISSFGYNLNDCTSFVDAAFKSNNDTLIFDLQANNWNIKSSRFFDLKNKTILFEEGVVVAAIKNSFNGIYDELFKFVRCQNINFIGYGAELRMNKAEYLALKNSEFRHGLSLENCINFKIKGLVIKDTGGDGIYVGGANYWQDNLTYSKDIIIEDVQCINNYRQGLSITSVENMKVINCHFSKTKGTLPEAGVDVEPFETYQRIVNLEFRNCKFFENNWSGLAIALVYMDSTSLPVSIEVNDCLFKDNGSEGHPYGNAEIYANTEYKSPVKGKVNFNRCVIDGSNYSAFYTRKTDASYAVKFKDCIFNHVSRKQKDYNEPIFMEVPDYDKPSPYIGGIEFSNVFISYPTNFSFFRVYGWQTLAGVRNITGDLTIVTTSMLNPKLENVKDSINYNLKFKKVTTLAKVPVAFTTIAKTLQECKGDSSVIKIKMDKELSYPLLINLSTEGTAKSGLDYNLITNTLVIAKGELLGSLNLKSRNDNRIESTESISVNIPDNGFSFKPTSDLLNYSIIDCDIANSIDALQKLNTFTVSPTLTNDFIDINASSEFKEVEIFDLKGRKVKTFKNINNDQKNISIYDLPSGVYYSRIIFSDGSSQVKKIMKI